MNSALYQPQQEALDWFTTHHRAIFGSAPGSGKTRVMVEHLGQARRILVVCALKSALSTWQHEIPKWLPSAQVTTYHGTPAQRLKLRNGLPTHGYVLTTPALLGELPLAWDAVVVDEAHILKGRKTHAFRRLSALRSARLYWMTGSPLINTPADLWVPLHLIDRRRFGSFWKWVYSHCNVEQGMFGLEIYGLKNDALTRKTLEPYYFAKTKADVAPYLPEKHRYPVYTALSSEQRKLYGQFNKDLMAQVGKSTVITANALAKMTRLRQLLIAPELLPGYEVGKSSESGTLDVLLPLIAQDHALGESVVIFTPFTEALRLLERELSNDGYAVATVHGGKSRSEVDAALSSFAGGEATVLICTIRSSASWSATRATVAYFVGYDFAPAYNLQAEDRLHRIGQEQSVDIRYIVNSGTIDEHILDILDRKTTWTDALFGGTHANRQ